MTRLCDREQERAHRAWRVSDAERGARVAAVVVALCVGVGGVAMAVLAWRWIWGAA